MAMQLQPAEEVIAKTRYLTLTNKRVVQEKQTFFQTIGGELWLEHIDSVAYERQFSWWLLALGVLFILGSYFLRVFGKVGIISFILAVICITWFFLRPHNVLVIKTSSGSIEASSLQELDEFRRQLDKILMSKHSSEQERKKKK